MQSPQLATLLQTPQYYIQIRERHTISPHTSHHSIQSPPSRTSTVNTIERYAQTSLWGKYGGYIAFFGGFLIQLTLGSIFTFGNLTPYMASYMTYNQNLSQEHPLSDTELEDTYNHYVSSANIILFIAITTDALCTVFGGDIEIYIGPTKTLFLASLCITLGFGLTCLGLIYNSIICIGITFAIFGCGVGIGYPIHPIVCMRWFPMRRGLVNGVISAIFGAGPFVFDAIQSKLVNPQNIAINAHFGYTKDDDIIERIPFMFVYVAGIMFTMQLLSLLCVKNPPWFVTVRAELDDAKKSNTQLLYEANSMTMKESMSHWSFWELWTSNWVYTVVLMWLTAEWKLFAVSYMNIQNDQLLAVIGSMGSLSNGIGRFVWGVFYDYTGSFRVSMGLQTAICAAFVMTLPVIPLIESVPIETTFTVWMIVMWFCAGCEYAFLPSVISETFGAKHTGAIIGVFVMAEPIAMGIVVLLSSVSFLQNNYNYYCIIVGAFCAVSTILSLLYRPNQIDRTNRSRLKLSIKNAKKYDSVNIETRM
eukprot:298719_1